MSGMRRRFGGNNGNTKRDFSGKHGDYNNNYREERNQLFNSNTNGNQGNGYANNGVQR
jgi:hypothetical protein